MDLFRRMLAVVSINLHHWKRDYRIWLILAFTAILIAEYLRGYTAYGIAEGKKMTFCLLPFLYLPSEVSLRAPKMLWHTGFLLLLCDAPFWHPVAPYMAVRSRRRGWWAGECLYVIVTAFLYMSFITAVSSLIALPAATLENDWGPAVTDYLFGTDTKTIGELLTTYPIGIEAPGDSVRFLNPFACEAYTFLAGWGSFCILGLLLYLLSILQENILLSLAAAGIFIFLDPILTFLAWPSRYWLQCFSPVCWTSVESLDILGAKRFISIPYVTVMSIVLIVFLLFVIGWRSRKLRIEAKQ